MNITVNDQPLATNAATVEDLVTERLGSTPEAGVAVAIDGNVVPRSAWAEQQLADGAVVDILTAVQGG